MVEEVLKRFLNINCCKFNFTSWYFTANRIISCRWKPHYLPWALRSLQPHFLLKLTHYANLIWYSFRRFHNTTISFSEFSNVYFNSIAIHSITTRWQPLCILYLSAIYLNIMLGYLISGKEVLCKLNSTGTSSRCHSQFILFCRAKKSISCPERLLFCIHCSSIFQSLSQHCWVFLSLLEGAP